MVKHCKLCKIQAVKGGDRSFHRFPDPQYQKEAWCRALNIDVKVLKKWMFICSDHFSPDSFFYRSNKQRLLKDDAIPFPYKGQLKRIGRKKRSKKDICTENDVSIKIECEEEQQLLNTRLDREIKVEKLYYWEGKDSVIANQEYSLNKIIKSEFTDRKCGDKNKDQIGESGQICANKNDHKKLLNTNLDRGIKIEQSEYWKDNDNSGRIDQEEYHLDASDNNNEFTEGGCGDKNKEIVGPFGQIIDDRDTPNKSEFDNCLDQGNSDEEKEDIFPKLFRLMYPKPKRHLSVDGLYFCKECSFQTTFYQNLKKHFIGHRETEFRRNPDNFKEYRCYRCQQCSYITIQKHNLSRHMIKHLPNDEKIIKIYSCDHCEYSTKYRCDIIKHRLKHIPHGTRVYCMQCSYIANGETLLKEHVEKGHIKNKIYKYNCEKCPFKTDSKEGLARHVRESHSENRPFKYECKFCSFKIDSKGSFNRHVKLGHPEVSQKNVQDRSPI